MYFKIFIHDYNKYLLRIEATFTAQSADVEVRVPYWRPGRYEGGKFPRNYIDFSASQDGNAIPAIKESPHSWKLSCNPNSEVKLSYYLQASELTAGNTYLDETFLLVNPVNSLLYISAAALDEQRVEFFLPEPWTLATSLAGTTALDPSAHSAFIAADVQELMDSPILTGSNMDDASFQIGDVDIHLHWVGIFPYDSEGYEADIQAFCEKQIQAFGSLPVDDYRFLLVFVPSQMRHGVEHERSTVIVMGPNSYLGTQEGKDSFLSIASHELYHTWNVKYLRPTAWNPYPFEGPAPSRLAYIAEGITTYMGDWMLWQAGVWSDSKYLSKLALLMERHDENEGRKHMSLADAAIDTWIDGYGGGAPQRRVSIYNEGALMAFVLDVYIMKHTEGDAGLWQVMTDMYANYDPQQGYSENDFWDAVSTVADRSVNQLRIALTEEKGGFESFLEDALGEMDLALNSDNPTDIKGHDWWGLAYTPVVGGAKVGFVAKDSPAELAGLWPGDIITKIDGISAIQFLEESDPEDMKKDPAQLEVKKGPFTRILQLNPDGNYHRKRFEITVQNANHPLWLAWKNALEED